MKDQEITLSANEQQFIQDHIGDDVQRLLLRLSGNTTLNIRKLANQIIARQKAHHKLPTWYANQQLIFPPALSVEQASSEQTARYKASLVKGDLLVDLTGGMGVDSWAFAQRVEQVIYVERNETLAALTAHNLPLLSDLTIPVTILAQDGLEFLQKYPKAPDWIYLDPARRDDQGGKVVRLDNCEPNVVELWPLLRQKAHYILLKTSPLIDIDATLRQLPGVEAVYIVAVQNEVKEVLFVAGQLSAELDQVWLTAVNLTNAEPVVFRFRRNDERTADIRFGNPERYIYEPNAALLKAGAFRILAARLGLKKLAPNSHLYTSSEQIDFPFGRTFVVQAICKPDRKSLQSALANQPLKANLTVRNFPQSAEELKKKLGLHDGGDIYMLATSLQNGDKRLLITKKPITT